MSQSLELGAELGQGEFGSVLKGIWTDPKGNKVKGNVKRMGSICGRFGGLIISMPFSGSRG